jgi:hypothetical protein
MAQKIFFARQTAEVGLGAAVIPLVARVDHAGLRAIKTPASRPS